ncbi:unnamed protein product [marine sediment metagenome]|uniref:Uncharacterized protein n=1 Tax=marine sediment metagenome TaxID=412755 RepID=X1CIZ7_9ZZZZ
MNDGVIRKLKKLFHSGVPERDIQTLTEYLICDFRKEVDNYSNFSNNTAIDLTMDLLGELYTLKEKP